MKHLKIFLILFILTLIQNSISFKSKYSMSSRNKHKSNLGKFTIKAITNSSAKANFKFLSKNQKNKPKNFKGNVGLEMENKGIVIATALENKKNDKMLKLISEKIASNTYLIDFRLFRSCDMNPKFKKNSENLSVSFSPKSLENKSKTDKFEINVDIKNFRHFIPIEKYSTEKEVKNYLLEICRQRKNSINLLKENFSEKIKNFQENSKKIRKLNSNINTQTIEIKNIKTAVKDTQRQINDINSLRKSYKIQIKSIEQLAKGTKNLIGKETQKSLDLRTKELQTESNLEKKEHQMKTKEEEIFKEKENFHKFIENSKDIENNLIKKQKKNFRRGK